MRRRGLPSRPVVVLGAGSVAACLAILFPPAGLLLFALWTSWALFAPDRAARPRIRPWLALAALLLALFTQQVLAGATPWMLAGHLGVLAVGGVVARVPRMALVLGGVAALIVLTAAVGTERFAASRTWSAADAVASSLPRLADHARRIETLAAGAWERSWGIRGSPHTIRISVETRLASGTPGTSWYAYHPSYRIEPRVEDDVPFTRIHPPPAAPISYVTRRVDTGSPLAGRSFRVRLDARAAEPVTTTGCTGVILREVRGSDAHACLPISLTDTWQPIELSWNAPAAAQSAIIRVELRIPGEWYDVRTVRLEELRNGAWESLGPLAPTGVWLRLATPGHQELYWPAHGFVPTGSWTEQTFDFDVRSWDHASARFVLEVEEGSELEMRRTVAIPLGPGGVAPEPTPPRQSAWLGHPNLLGHGVVAAGLVTMSAAGATVGGLIAAPMMALGVFASSSRGALAGMILGLVLLAVQWNRRTTKRAWMAYTILASAGLLVAVGVASLDRLQVWRLEGGNTVSRTEIWQAAWHMMVEEPWSGVGEGGFGDQWVSAYPSDGRTVPQHAHNFWLHWGAIYGVFGLASAVALTLGIAWIAWRQRRGRGLAIVVPILAMQVIDYTFFSAYVLVPLLMGLNLVDDGPAASTPSKTAPTSSEPQ